MSSSLATVPRAGRLPWTRDRAGRAAVEDEEGAGGTPPPGFPERSELPNLQGAKLQACRFNEGSTTRG